MDDLFGKVDKLLTWVTQDVYLIPALDKYFCDCQSYKGHIRAFNVHKKCMFVKRPYIEN